MSKILPYGVPDKHILKSYGADTDILKFYCTQNSTTYGARWPKFEPRMGSATGSGYTSNVRPVITYSARLDEVDNPAMGRIVADNNHTVTERSFRPYMAPTGNETLPNSLHYAGTGFVRGKILHNATSSEVKAACIGARISSAPPIDILPRHKPYLHKIQPKDPVELENGGYGPGCMTTETKERFKVPSANDVNLYHKTVSANENTGYTSNHNIEPLTFHPDYAYLNDAPGCLTPRPTGVSITDTDYRPSALATGKEPFPKVATRSEHDSGFTHSLRNKPELVSMRHPNTLTSVTQDTYVGQQRPEPSAADRLHSTTVGPKENTGFMQNSRHFWTADCPGRFITDYQIRFQDRTPQGNDREGHVWGGVMKPRDDGFTRSTALHSHGPEISSTSTLRRLEPYVARSIKVRDTFYDDHVYDSKLKSTAMVF